MARQKLTHAYYAFASYIRREGHLFEVFLVLAKTRFIRRVSAKSRLIFDEMCRSFGKFASYLRRVLCKTRLIFPCMNSPNDDDDDDYGIDEYGKNGLQGGQGGGEVQWQ